MNGRVDESLRAMLDISVAASSKVGDSTLAVWIDTAFNGGLVVPQHQIDSLGLQKSSTIEAVLADGQSVNLDTYTCYLDWFGSKLRTQVVASDAERPLLGTILLSDRKLKIDYPAKTLALE